ncbi:MAG: 2TM domain-containing protein [Nocardioidaceae bacterium]
MESSSPPSPDDALRQQALERLKKKRDFRTHLFMYVLVNALFVVIWAIATPDALFWPIFPMLGWGVGLAANAWDVYARRPITEEDVRREAERMRR